MRSEIVPPRDSRRCLWEEDHHGSNFESARPSPSRNRGANAHDKRMPGLWGKAAGDSGETAMFPVPDDLRDVL